MQILKLIQRSSSYPVSHVNPARFNGASRVDKPYLKNLLILLSVGNKCNTVMMLCAPLTRNVQDISLYHVQSLWAAKAFYEIPHSEIAYVGIPA